MESNIKLSPFKFEKFLVIESRIKRKKRSDKDLVLNYRITPSGIIDEAKRFMSSNSLLT